MAFDEDRLDMHQTCCMQNQTQNLHSQCMQSPFLACMDLNAKEGMYKKNLQQENQSQHMQHIIILQDGNKSQIMK